MNEKIVVFNNVTKKYGDVCALSDISFCIPANMIVGLIGANGAGKTTILKHVVKYLRPDSGFISLFGKEIYAYKNEEYPVSFIPDEPVYYEELTVAEHLKFISTMYESEDKVHDLISLLELNQHLNKVPGILSKGTLQKLMIACALLRKHDLLVADEPFSGLDPKQIVVLKELFNQERKAGKTVVISTHLLATIENLCDYYIFIDHGVLLCQGTLEDLINKSRANSLEDIYLILSKNSEDLQTDSD